MRSLSRLFRVRENLSTAVARGVKTGERLAFAAYDVPPLWAGHWTQPLVVLTNYSHQGEYYCQLLTRLSARRSRSWGSKGLRFFELSTGGIDSPTNALTGYATR